MNGLKTGVRAIQIGVGGSKTTKEAIVNAYNSSEYILKEIKNIEEKVKQEIKEKSKLERIYITPEEVQQIVLRAKNGEDR